MMLLPCPWCGPRNVSEFRHLGETVMRPDPSATTPAEWRTYLYFRDNRSGWTTEGWYHRAGCRQYFTIQRDMTTNRTLPLSGRSVADAERATIEAAKGN